MHIQISKLVAESIGIPLVNLPKACCSIFLWPTVLCNQRTEVHVAISEKFVRVEWYKIQVLMSGSVPDQACT